VSTAFDSYELGGAGLANRIEMATMPVAVPMALGRARPA
jgi:hypothetical protein